MFEKVRRYVLSLVLVSLILPGLVTTAMGECLSHTFGEFHSHEHSSDPEQNGSEQASDPDGPQGQSLQHDSGTHFHETADRVGHFCATFAVNGASMRPQEYSAPDRLLIYSIDRPPKFLHAT